MREREHAAALRRVTLGRRAQRPELEALRGAQREGLAVHLERAPAALR